MRISIIEAIDSSLTKKDCIDLVNTHFTLGKITSREEYEFYLSYIEWGWER